MSDLFSYAPAQATELAVAQADEPHVFGVSELSQHIKNTLESAFGTVRVEGEISNFRPAASGHVYFKVKDDKSTLNVVMWRSSAARLSVQPEEGMQVVLGGQLTSYGARSEYQLIASSLRPAGMGTLMQLLEQRKTALMAEGLFDETRKRPLPQFPQKIGIITSPTGAVIQDMLHRLRARFPVQVLLWPTLVQGEGASAQIAAAIQGMNQLPESQKPDVLIIARGGGSLEDLWAFNEEELVRAVAASGIPTISGVGHEPDVTLCDYAADLRAPTPTAAAELAVPVLDDILYTLGQQQNRLHRGVTRYLQTSAQRLDYAARQLPRPDVLLRQTQQQVAQLHTRLQRGMQHVLELKKQQVKSSAKLLESYAPQAPLKRGYAFVTRDGARDFVTSVAGATGTVTVHFHDGSKQATLS